MTAFLPQDDPSSAQRARQLLQSRSQYTYNYTHLSPLALLDRVPIRDEFSFRWLEMVAERALVGLRNLAEIEIDEVNRKQHFIKLNLFAKLLEVGATGLHELKSLVTESLKFNARLGSDSRRPDSLDDYNRLFHKIGLPPIAGDFRNDSAFAWMRVGGPNPVMLERVHQLEDRFPVTDSHLQRVQPGDTLAAAIAEGRLYLVDYHMLDGVEQGDFPEGQKYIYAPMAMFVADPATRQLLPFAIQIKQRPAADNPILTPADGWNWLIAKSMVEVSDGNVHEAATHLGRTHMFIEPFVVTTYRQLPSDHPVALLLAPHFEGTLAINAAAWQHLIADKGAVEKLFGASVKAARGLTAASILDNRFNDVMLPDTFAKRGVADRDLLPDYPYRDDSMLYWAAIAKWVADYLAICYPNEGDPQQDAELQAWFAELVSIDGGRVVGFGEAGGIRTRTYLTNALTLVIYTCSVQHAAVNFPQYDLMSYMPNMPLASYAPAPTKQSGATEQDYLNMLPPVNMAELQMNLGYLLGTVHYTQLGQYPNGHFRDDRIADALKAFQDRVTSIGETIAERNTTRRPYEFLVPSGVPQSINI